MYDDIDSVHRDNMSLILAPPPDLNSYRGLCFECLSYSIFITRPDFYTYLPLLRKLAIQIEFVSAVHVRDPQEALKLSF